LSQYLQKSNLDLATALKQIETITLTFQKNREICSAVFDDIYKEAKAIATLLNVEEKKPRL